LQVKSEIQTSVSRQLEWLRTRELHLLEQVELIQAAKEELLSQQQETLHQALGGLHSSLDVGASAPHL
jgi:nuclear receptor coactivator 4